MKSLPSSGNEDSLQFDAIKTFRMLRAAKTIAILPGREESQILLCASVRLPPVGPRIFVCSSRYNDASSLVVAEEVVVVVDSIDGLLEAFGCVIQ